MSGRMRSALLLAVLIAPASCATRAAPPPASASKQHDDDRAAKIQAVVLLHVAALRRCYDDGRSRDPHLNGRLELEFVVSADGVVTSAQALRSTIADELTVGCVLSTARSWRFAQFPNGPVTFSYPVIFETR